MKIFLTLSAIPIPDGEAIDIVSLEVLKWLTDCRDEIYLQIIIREKKDDKFKNLNRKLVNSFKDKNNIFFEEIVYLGDIIKPSNNYMKYISFFKNIFMSLPLLRTLINTSFFPAIVAKKQIESVIRRLKPDIIVNIWSWEALSLTYSIKNVPKYIYYGNPNHKPLEAQLLSPELFGMQNKTFLGKCKLALSYMQNRAREIQHLKMINSCEMISNNSVVDSEYYSSSGHQESHYLQNMWPENNQIANNSYSVKKVDEEMIIAGSVGNLAATGNTFGLNYLGKEIIPELKKLHDKPFKVNIYGGGIPRPVVKKNLMHDEIIMRGWVDDIEKELLASDSFLVLTNATGFIVGNTRLLLAWSLGICVIGHSNSALSMPEIEHNNNALLGDSPEEIARLIIDASTNQTLRNKIGRGGYDTFIKYYTPQVVMPKMYSHIKQCAKK